MQRDCRRLHGFSGPGGRVDSRRRGGGGAGSLERRLDNAAAACRRFCRTFSLPFRRLSIAPFHRIFLPHLSTAFLLRTRSGDGRLQAGAGATRIGCTVRGRGGGGSERGTSPFSSPAFRVSETLTRRESWGGALRAAPVGVQRRALGPGAHGAGTGLRFLGPGSALGRKSLASGATRAAQPGPRGRPRHLLEARGLPSYAGRVAQLAVRRRTGVDWKGFTVRNPTTPALVGPGSAPVCP